LIDSVAMVIDLRIQTTSITAEQALTQDTMPVGGDAIVFCRWRLRGSPAGRNEQGSRRHHPAAHRNGSALGRAFTAPT
jgi:hypothetical protein